MSKKPRLSLLAVIAFLLTLLVHVPIVFRMLLRTPFRSHTSTADILLIALYPLAGAVMGALALVLIKRRSDKLRGGALAGTAIAVGSIGACLTLLWAITVGIPARDGTRTFEAYDMVGEIFRSSLSYATEGQADAGPESEVRFPESAPLTPARSCCEHPDGRCLGNEAEWDHPTWNALRFARGDPYRFRAQYISNGTYFTARVVGDWDCDGEAITFERAARVNSEGDVEALRGVSTSGHE